MSRKFDCILSVIIALLAEFIYYFFCAKWSAEGKYSNLVIYILGAVLFFIVYLISMYGLSKIKFYEMQKDLRIVAVVSVLVVLTVFVQTLFLYCPNPFNDSFGTLSQ